VAAGAHAFALLVAARIVAATGSAVATPLALATIDRVAEETVRGRAHGIVFTGFSLAAMLGVPFGTLIAAQFGWRWTFGCVGALAAGAAGAALATIPTSGPGSTLTGPALRRMIARPNVRRTLIVSALFLTAQYTAYTYFRPYFFATAGAGVDAIVRLFFVFGVFGIIGTLLAGVAIDRYGPRPTLLLALTACGATFVVLPLAGRSFGGADATVAVWALTSWGFGPAVNRQLDIAAGAARDVALAFNLTAFNIGIAAGSALGGVTIALAGIARLPWTAAALCAVALVAAVRPPARAKPLRGHSRPNR
jgi:DHA1 family inner membrane transport protein